MNKTKRTLIISSFVMLLALVVTIVSVSAAWFSMTDSSRQDGLIIGSDTLSEFASIDKDALVAEGGENLWPAIATKGWLLQHGPSDTLLEGPQLKTANTSKGVQTGAQVAHFYFPITFVGAPDTDQADGRKTLKLSLDSAKCIAPGSKLDPDQDFRGDFNVELLLCTATPAPTAENPSNKTFNDISLTGVNPASLTGDQVYYNQPVIAGGNPGYNLYMLVVPGTEYYIHAVVYFNKIDEECNHELFYETVTFSFTLSMLTVNEGGVNIRTNTYPA